MTRTSKIATAAALVFVAAGMSAGPAAAWHSTEGAGSGKHARHQEGSAPGGCFNSGGAQASAAAIGSPGILSGNVVQVPVSVPVNLCGNSVNIAALLDGVGGGGDGGGGGGNN
jgi:hypothetical protein